MDDIAFEKRVLSLFECLLEVPEEEQAQWLRRHTAGNQPLHDRLSAVWQANKTISLRTGTAVETLAPSPPPDQVGAYRIIGEIGSGGMGTVYSAERLPDDFEHRVAIKLIKPGLLSSALVERFERERQMLARLNHPHIARLYDGGLHDGNAPYIVMELVEGKTLSEWVCEHDPSRGRRLDLFEQVATAVHYAHQNLVVHRDLTPANILVTGDDQAKLIDFGIAQVPEPAEPKSSAARKGAHIMTPGYGAPEQVDQAEVSILSDIYSLGRVLNFLVGQYHDPELEAVVAKATRADPTERYVSVAALLSDVRNFRALRPVRAFSRRRSYAFGKFVKRQKFAASAGALGVMALVVGGGALIAGLQQARSAQAEAEIRLGETQSMANLLMFEVFDEVSNTAGTTKARLLIARNAQEFLENIAANDPSPATQLRAGKGFYRLAQVTGGFAPGNTGELTKGIEYLERSQALLDPLLGDTACDEIRIASAHTQIALMRSKGSSYIDVEGAIQHGENALRILDKVRQRSAEVFAAEAVARRYLGDYLACCTGQPQRGIGFIENGYQQITAAPASMQRDPAVRRATNDLLNLRAGVRIFTGSDADGIPLFYEALEAQTKLVRETRQPEDFDLQAVIASNLTRTLLRMGRPAEAERVIEPIHHQARSAIEADPVDSRLQRHLATMSLSHAWIAAELGRSQESRQLLEEGLRYARQADWPEGIASLPSLAYAHHLQEASEAQWALGRITDACQTMRQALDMYAEYAATLVVPVTSQLYRISRMQPRMEQCPKS